MPPSALTGLPFDDIRALLRDLPPLPTVAGNSPAGLAAAPAASPPRLTRPGVALFIARPHPALRALAGHAAGEDEARLHALQEGSDPAARTCAAQGLGLKVFELALAHPAGDLLTGPSLAEADCAATMAYGMEAVAGGADLLGLAGFAIGGDLAAAALCRALLGGNVDQWLDPAEGDQGERQRAALHPLPEGGLDPLEALRHFGGREMAALAGAILAARLHQVPVVIEGMAALAAAAVLQALEPSAIAHVRLARVHGASQERLARHLGLTPLIAIDTGDGPGQGAVLALALLKLAVNG